MELPILKFEEEIVETVRKNSIVVLIGETGSGKSTQLSQILHRHGYTKSRAIGITQPRRVAAVSVSRRVASELGVTLGEEVGYAIRFEDRTSQKTCIKYLTDGVLLRESLSDPELNHYSVIILDEAHERSLNTDILLGLMKRLIKVRPSNLKVLITSATLDGAKVSKFFSGCPVLTIPGKLFPVEIHYSKGTPTSYLEASIGTALELPLEPSLSRTLIAANELGCLPQALTVAAMLSAENIWTQTSRKNNEKKRKPIQNLPDGSGWGDHIQLLQIYETWSQADYDPKWCIDHNLQVRGMMFAKEVRKQLSQIMQKIARGPTDVQSKYRRQNSSEDYAKLRWALCKGFANQLAQRMIHHNGYRTLSHRSQLVQVHPSSVLQPDEYGSLPDYVVYNELITTSRPFMRYVCAVKLPWIMPISEKLEKMDINLLSGGQSAKNFGSPRATSPSCNLESAQHDVTKTSEEHEKKIQAARERFLARRLKK